MKWWAAAPAWPSHSARPLPAPDEPDGSDQRERDQPGRELQPLQAPDRGQHAVVRSEAIEPLLVLIQRVAHHARCHARAGRYRVMLDAIAVIASGTSQQAQVATA